MTQNTHNDIPKLLVLQDVGAIPQTAGLHNVTVRHDYWCGIFDGGLCDCDPTIWLKWSQEAAAQN